MMVRSDSIKLGKNSPPQLQWKPTPKSSERSWKRSWQLSKSDNEPNTAGAEVAADTGKVHTPTMTLKNAALLALIGTILITVLLVWTFFFNVVNVLRGLADGAKRTASTVFSSQFLYGKISSFASEPLAESGLIQTVTFAASTAN